MDTHCCVLMFWFQGFILVLIDRWSAHMQRRFRKAHSQETIVSFDSLLLWIPTTIFHIVAANLMRFTTATSLYICYEQWYAKHKHTHTHTRARACSPRQLGNHRTRFGQVRTLVPTALFSLVEISQDLWAEVMALRRQRALNYELKLTTINPPVADQAPADAAVAEEVQWRSSPKHDLVAGCYVQLRPGEVAPGTCLLLGVLRNQGQRLVTRSTLGAPYKVVTHVLLVVAAACSFLTHPVGVTIAAGSDRHSGSQRRDCGQGAWLCH